MSKKAAAVPASKAEIGTIYAVRHPDTGKLSRFRVDRVTTHRVGATGSPHDYESEIGGVFVLDRSDDADSWGTPGYKTSKPVTIKPNELLGEFTQYQELVAQRDREEAAKRAKDAAEKQAATDLIALLYRISGLEPTGNRYHDSFEASYGHSVDIRRAAVAPLLEGLRKLVPETDASDPADNVVQLKG